MCAHLNATDGQRESGEGGRDDKKMRQDYTGSILSRRRGNKESGDKDKETKGGRWRDLRVSEKPQNRRRRRQGLVEEE